MRESDYKKITDCIEKFNKILSPAKDCKAVLEFIGADLFDMVDDIQMDKSNSPMFKQDLRASILEMYFIIQETINSMNEGTVKVNKQLTQIKERATKEGITFGKDTEGRVEAKIRSYNRLTKERRGGNTDANMKEEDDYAGYGTSELDALFDDPRDIEE